MAEIIQSEIRVVHTVEGGTPTQEAVKPTDVDVSEETEDITEKEDLKGFTKFLGATSAKRRILNYGIAGVERAINHAFDQRLFQESLYGDSRGMRKIQSQKSNANIITNEAKALGGVIITSFALKNPVLGILHGLNMANKIIATSITRQQERDHFVEKTNLELYTNRKRQERLIIGTYNRRW